MIDSPLSFRCLVIIAALCVGVASGCEKQDEPPDETTTAGSGTAAAAGNGVQADGCLEGATRIETPPICLNLPPNTHIGNAYRANVEGVNAFKVVVPSPEDDGESPPPGAYRVVVTWYTPEMSTYDEMVASRHNDAKQLAVDGTDVEVEELESPTRTSIRYAHGDADDTEARAEHVGVVMKGATHTVVCWPWTPAGDPGPAALHDACASLRLRTGAPPEDVSVVELEPADGLEIDDAGRVREVAGAPGVSEDHRREASAAGRAQAMKLLGTKSGSGTVEGVLESDLDLSNLDGVGLGTGGGLGMQGKGMPNRGPKHGSSVGSIGGESDVGYGEGSSDDDDDAGSADSADGAPASPDAVGNDLLKLCEIATEVQADASIPDDRKPVEIATRFKATSPEPETAKIMRSLAGVSPDNRQQHLIDAAHEHGVKDFTCPALEGD